MNTEENNQAAAEAPEATEGEGGAEDTGETVTMSKSELGKLHETLGSLKRELKDLKKKEDAGDTSKQNQTDQSTLTAKLERMSLKAAGITHADDVELAQKTAKKWGMDIDDVVDDEDFKLKLERQRTDRSNVEATSNVRGNKTGASSKTDASFYIARGTPPTKEEVPNRADRVKIVDAMMPQKGGGKKFYND